MPLDIVTRMDSSSPLTELEVVKNFTAIKSALGPMLSQAAIVSEDGAVHTLSEVQAVFTLTATATASSSPCLFRGIVVRALVGGPQTVTVYDATSASGTPIAVFNVSAVGTYFWDGDWLTAGNGQGGRRINSTGCHLVVSGGTSRTIDVMVENL